MLAAIKTRHNVPIVTDIHEPAQAAAAAEVADVLQIPAFLSRQTDLIVAAARTGRVVNIKKGQFLAPDDIRHAVAKVVDAGNSRVIVTERGTSFGYHNLVVDMRALPMMRQRGIPVVFDVTHSLQLPGGGDGVTSGQAEYIEPLASAGVAAGVDGVFLEVHDDPARAKSDAQNALRLDLLEPLLRRLLAIDAIVKQAEAGKPAVRGVRLMADRTLARKVLETEAAAILALVSRLDERFDRAVDLLLQCRGRVILTGMGKSGIICQKIAATLASTGTPAFFLHPAEAMHGDLGVIQGDDVVVALSYSGETDEILNLIETIRRLGARLIAITGVTRSALAQAADVALDCGVAEEACPLNLVPTASTTAALAMGDALAMTLLKAKGFRQEDFASLHPGGKLGKRLMRVDALMHAGKQCPIVQAGTGMRDVIYEMSSKGLGHDVRRRRRRRAARHHHRRRPAASHGERRRHPTPDRRRRHDARTGVDSTGHARGRGAQHHGTAQDHVDRRRRRRSAARGRRRARARPVAHGAVLRHVKPIEPIEPEPFSSPRRRRSS